MEHVIVNLLSNAVEFSLIGGIIRLNVTSTLMRKRGNKKESSRIKVSISDAGPGQSAEDQSKLFGGFFHVRPVHIHIQQGKGSGLGLALIVNLHGGTIGVVSEEGQGSTIYFSIPFCTPSEESQGGIVS